MPSAMPGTRRIGSSRLRLPTSSLTTSSSVSPFAAAVAGLTSSGLSQVALVIASGSSCSQALFAFCTGLELRTGQEHELELSRSRRRRRTRGAGELADDSRLELELHARQRALRQDTVVQHPVPALLEVGRAEDLPPGRLDDVVAGPIFTTRQQAQELDGAPRAVERKDQRLHHAQRPTARARVAPGLEEVRARHVPGRERRGLVDVAAEVHELLGLCRGRRELEIGGRVVGGVAAQHDERLHLAVAQRRDEIGEGRGRRQQRVDRLVVQDGDPDVAERGVERHDRGVHGRRLARPRHDHGRAAVRQQVLGERREPRGVHTRHVGRAPRRRSRARPGAARPRAPRRRPGCGAPASRSRWSAFAPVIEKTASTAHSRFIGSPGAETRRPALKPRVWRIISGSACSTSASSARIAFALSSW